MKRLALLNLLLIVCITAFAQSDSVFAWNKWSSRKDTTILFNGGNNIIEIYSPAFKPADIKLKSLDASLRIGTPEIKGDTATVMAMPYPTKGRNMRLAVINKKTNKTIKIINWNSDNIPPLVARIGVIQTNEAAKKDILLQQTMRTAFPNSLYSYPYKIKEFTFKVQTPKGNAVINTSGFFITKEMLQQIHDAPEGTIITFTNIKATCPECAVRTLEDLKIKIR